jgi:hypothetical protein
MGLGLQSESAIACVYAFDRGSLIVVNARTADY